MIKLNRTQKEVNRVHPYLLSKDNKSMSAHLFLSMDYLLVNWENERKKERENEWNYEEMSDNEIDRYQWREEEEPLALICHLKRCE